MNEQPKKPDPIVWGILVFLFVVIVIVAWAHFHEGA